MASAPSRTSLDRNDATTTIHLSEGARAKLYAASGAFELTRGWEAHQLPISDDADKLDRARLTEQATSALAKLELDRLGNDEKLEFERLWLIKSHRCRSRQPAESGSSGPSALPPPARRTPGWVVPLHSR